jgi:Protein of unknown function (DUF2934)
MPAKLAYARYPAMERKVLKGVLPGAASGAENCNSGSLAEMDTPTTEQILKRTYEIWEKNNKTEGRDEEFLSSS